MASILLANPPLSLARRYGALALAGSTLPHLGLLSLGAVLRQKGHRVRVLDAPAQGLGPDEVVEAAAAFAPDMAGVSAVTASIASAGALAALLKNRLGPLPVVAGGPHVTALPGDTLRQYPALDFAVCGEGEETLAELAAALEAGRPASSVAGVCFLEGGKEVRAKARPKIQNLDTLPHPAWDLMDGFPGRFRPALFKYLKLPAAHLVTSRGCPHSCVFCDRGVFGTRPRRHSAPYVLDMVRALARGFGVREIIFEDDQFLEDKQRAAAIAEGLLKDGPRVSWSCLARVSGADDPDLLGLMRRAGCWQISFGLESANQEILDKARKGITVSQSERAVCLAHEAGMAVKGFFILGLPGETQATIRQTLSFARSLPLSDASVFLAAPFPGTALADMAGDSGRINGGFPAMNVMDPAFVPAGMTPESLARHQRLFFSRFYLRPRIMGQHALLLLRNPRSSLLDAWARLPRLARRGRRP